MPALVGGQSTACAPVWVSYITKDFVVTVLNSGIHMHTMVHMFLAMHKRLLVILPDKKLA